MNVGVLALQGDVREHVEALCDLGVSAKVVKLPRDLEDLHGLILPGGESTTIGKLMVIYDLVEPIRERILAGKMAAWGTCAGMILLSKDVGTHDQPLLGVMDTCIQRNAFGSQVDSFEAEVPIQAIGDAPFPAVFIRAPVVESIGPDVKVLGRLPSNGWIVAIQQETMFATSFHPEIVKDRRLHQHFLTLCALVGA
ncbi:MAG: pyridoxal 5'-phosphate synthase glutaminase subunit PdxT [Chloroflexota bacterium]|nr:pyridoxal 5'-phosphate synthase glutaminase subunit PdxT [Chloroflexota bacterium]MDE2930499.1 pyridoxal 5'-phosphate synthase glutaminase subunit PdxT [Chloroflexota bacterium]